MKLAIAIDGPSGAGKSTLARALAQRCGFLYVDTGAMYRAVGLYTLEHGADPKDGEAVQALLPDIHLALRHENGEQHILLNGRDVTRDVRREDVGMAASGVSAHPPVRAFLLETQRRLARENSVVMDGRDIGTVVLPDAEIKIFLTAAPEERARRRCEQLREQGQSADYDEVLRDVRRRDENDTTRAVSPLRQAEDAVLVDTTGNTFEQSLARLSALIDEKREGLR